MAPVVVGLRAYPIFVALAALSGVLVTILCARRAGLPLARLFGLQAVLAFAAFLGAKLFWLWEMGVLDAPLSVPFTTDGLRYPGGILAVLLCLPLLAPRFGVPVARLGDVAAPAVALAMAVVRIGCLLQGCCFGTVSNLPWAITFPSRSKAWTEHVSAGLIPRSHPHSLPVHPLQVYFGLWSLLVAVLLLRLQRRPHRDGDVLLCFLVLHEGGKAALELLRVPPHPELQLVSGALAVVAAAAWLARRNWGRESYAGGRAS